MFPLVYGIVATDLDGAIAFNNNGEPELISKLADQTTEALDRNVLMRFLDNIGKGDLIVIGRNTYNHMKAMLSNKGKIILVSDQEGTQEYMGVYAADEKKPFTNGISSKDQLMLRAFEIAMRYHSQTSIHVLGGRSVYEAFGGHYYTFTHCVFNDTFNADQKTCIQVKSDSVSMRRENQLLDYNVPFSRYIDTSVYQVNVYSYSYSY